MSRCAWAVAAGLLAGVALAGEPAATRPAEKKEQPIRLLGIGEPAPDFDLPGVDGKRHKLKDLAEAKLLVVVFTCNHCPTACAYEERLKKLVDDYKPKGVALVAISPNDPKAVRLDELGYTDLSDSLEEMQIRAKHQAFNFPYLYDGETQEVSKKYGPAATPTVYIFDAGRKLRYVGRVDDAERESEVKTQDTRKALDALLAGKPVPVEKTRTFGCSIKWADKRDSVEQFMKKLAAEPVSLEAVDADGLKKLLGGKSEKIRLVNFWATWCGECVTEMPELVTINRMYRNRDFEMVTVSTDRADKKDEALKLLKKLQASNKNLLFGGDPYAMIELVDKDWDGNLPYTVLLDKDGKALLRKAGMIDPMEVRRAIVKAAWGADDGAGGMSGFGVEGAAMVRCAAVALLAGCGQAVRTEGLRVGPANEPLVDLSDVDARIIADVRYATADNFMKRVLYPANRVLLRESVAWRLKAVQDALAEKGLGLKVYDGYRPLSVQKLMWEVMPNEDFVANPAKGSRHNRGAAVDVTLVDASGGELEMPSGYDEFSERAHVSYAGGSAEARRNRDRLIAVMRRHGFTVLKTEWWHYDAPGWERYAVLDEPLVGR